jgi:hypothetical protein
MVVPSFGLHIRVQLRAGPVKSRPLGRRGDLGMTEIKELDWRS